MPLVGYRLPPNRPVADIFEDYDNLLRSEGIDPTWLGFEEATPESR